MKKGDRPLFLGKSHQAHDLLSPRRAGPGIRADEDVVLPCLKCFDQVVDLVFLHF